MRTCAGSTWSTASGEVRETGWGLGLRGGVWRGVKGVGGSVGNQHGQFAANSRACVLNPKRPKP